MKCFGYKFKNLIQRTAFVNCEVDFLTDLDFDIVFPLQSFSTWTFHRPPRYLWWKFMDIWLTTHPPLLVHVVIERPQMSNRLFFDTGIFEGLSPVPGFLRGGCSCKYCSSFASPVRKLLKVTNWFWELLELGSVYDLSFSAKTSTLIKGKLYLWTEHPNWFS